MILPPNMPDGLADLFRQTTGDFPVVLPGNLVGK